MVIAALVSFGALMVAWIFAPDGRPTELMVASDEPEAVPIPA